MRFPLAAPSANLPTHFPDLRTSTNNWGSACAYRGWRAGASRHRSTVIDLVAQPPRVLRPGMIHEESLLAALGEAGLPGVQQRRAWSEPAVPVYCRSIIRRRPNWWWCPLRDPADLNAQLSKFNLTRPDAYHRAFAHPGRRWFQADQRDSRMTRKRSRARFMPNCIAVTRRERR